DQRASPAPQSDDRGTDHVSIVRVSREWAPIASALAGSPAFAGDDSEANIQEPSLSTRCQAEYAHERRHHRGSTIRLYAPPAAGTVDTHLHPRRGRSRARG